MITPQQAYLHAILDVILRHTDAGKAIYGPGGERLRAGDRLTMNDLASTMEILAEGVLRLYEGVLAERITSCIRAGGGALTGDDFRGYRVIWRRPITAEFLDTDSSRTRRRPPAVC